VGRKRKSTTLAIHLAEDVKKTFRFGIKGNIRHGE
jgi:hypothetical protein